MTAGRRLRQLHELPISVLSGVSPRKAAALGTLGIRTVFDLLTTFPRRYIDRTRTADVADLAVGDEAVVLAVVQRSRRRRDRSGRVRVELDVADRSGRMTVVFFNQPYREHQLPVGSEVLLFGKLTVFRGLRQMVNPVVDLLTRGDAPRRTLRVVPVYPASAKAGLNSWELGAWVEEALDRAGTFADPLPPHWRERLKLMDRTTAMRRIHLPSSLEEVAPARRRLVFDELFRVQLTLLLQRRAVEEDLDAVRHEATCGPLLRRFKESLPFDLTAAQEKAFETILADLGAPTPMHRLLQGDVGSGKTVVAALALLVAVQGGHQGALMVPTEVLAEQHFFGLRSLTGSLMLPDATRLEGERPLMISLLTSRTPSAQRRRTLRELAHGGVDIVVGTHALLTEGVRFRSLGLVVIDEQHRFGVDQRATLRTKGQKATDLLVMTATPIPRTAAMIVFGDLDLTVLEELPPGRSPVETIWARDAKAEERAWARVRSEVASGHRAYVVCPLVELAEQEFRRLRQEVFPDLRLALLHGQMPTAEKESVMADFRRGLIDVLVATTVIEVGIDVKDATVMVIENAERFGLAQLHQLRGRVGRGSAPSWCYLLSRSTTADARERLGALERTNDGFELAEIDLRLRGEGEVLGARQSGAGSFRLTSLQRDRHLVEPARAAAKAILDADPDLAAHQLLADELRLFLDDAEARYLLES